jgi:lipoprotein NlpI
MAFLQSVQGGKWHADLARYGSGQLSEAELTRHADTPGKQAEANFYLAQAALRRGDRNQASELWRKVIQSSMLGFFEYEMSSLYLRKGAPSQPVLRSKVPTAPAAPARRAK